MGYLKENVDFASPLTKKVLSTRSSFNNTCYYWWVKIKIETDRSPSVIPIEDEMENESTWSLHMCALVWCWYSMQL